MNVVWPQLDYQSVSIIAIVLSIVSLCFVGISYFNVQGRFLDKIKIVWKARFVIFHIVTFIFLTIYVVLDWKKCVSMQLFSEFNGNNILFVAWIALIFLNMYKVKIKDVEVIERKAEEKLQEDVQNVELNYQAQQIDMIQKNINS